LKRDVIAQEGTLDAHMAAPVAADDARVIWV